jgi:hypothetical protein
MNKASIMLLLVSIVFCAVGVPEAVAQGENYVVRVAEDGERYNYTVRIVDSQLITVTNAAKLILEGLPDAVTLTEVTYLDGATGPLQTQIDGKQAYGTRIVLVDCNLAADVTGKAYNTVAEAIAYAVTQTPSSASPWLIVIRPGVYVESITCAEYVDLLGDGVEIQTATDATAAVNLSANVLIQKITARATAGASVKAFQLLTAATGVTLRDCQGIVDSVCTGNTDGFYAALYPETISGEFINCYFEAPYDGANIAEVGTLRMRDCRFYGYQTGTSGTANVAVTTTDTTLVDTRLAMTTDQYIGYTVTCDGKTLTVTGNDATTFTGASWSGGGNPGDGDSWTVGNATRAAGLVLAKGTVYADNCEFVSSVGATSTGIGGGLWLASGSGTTLQMTGCRATATSAGAGNVYAVYAPTVRTMNLDGCVLTASGTSTGTATGLACLTASASGNRVVSVRECSIVASGVSANSTGVLVNQGGAGGTIALTMVGGSTTVSGAGTNYDAVNTAGTLSLENVASGGAFSGTITKAGTVTASAFSGATVTSSGSNTADTFISTAASGAPFSSTSTDVCTNVNADLLDGVTGASYVNDSDFTSDDTVLVGTGAGTYEAVTIAEQTLLGRITAGSVDDLSVTQIKALIGDADDDGATKGVAAFVNDDFDDASGVISLAADVIRDADVDDVAVDAATTAPISSNWAFDHKYRVVNFVIDGGGYEIPTGIQGDIMIDHACTITSWTLLADQSGAIKVDIWEDVYDNFPPLGAGEDDSICNAHEPEIAASGVKAQDLDIADWSGEGLSAGSILRINVDSVTDITRCTLVLYLTED